jgi:decaprenylphospho-beta-D-erythro-pentofuranosid-2-ulose 2-reductase
MKKVVIFGANSAIAQATARRFVTRGDALFLVSRNLGKLEALVQDLQVRGAKSVGYLSADLNDTALHEDIFKTATKHLNGCDIVLLAHGELGNDSEAQTSFTSAEAIFRTNFLSPVSLCTIVAQYFEIQKSGCIAAISSVAGDRGRQSNYIYGSAKGALSLYLQGLRNRLFHSGVHVLTIKPGFVDTPMTAAFKKGFLWAKPDAIARGIVSGIDAKRNSLYLPSFWWIIMTIIKSVPEAVFKRARL